MNTEIFKIESDKDLVQQIAKAGEMIREGKLVAFPTETVYGLGGNALDKQAAERIYKAKGRPSDNPLIVHIADLESLDRITKRVSKEARALAQAFWPGPLTMIFEKNDQIPYSTSGGLETVGVRMPSHQVALQLIRLGGGYIAAPSANVSGRPSPTCAAHVIEDLSGKIDGIIDDGVDSAIGLESTIVDMTESIPVILRPGFITPSMIREVIGEVEVDKGLLSQDHHEKPKAPGMKYKHYAPQGELYLVRGDRQEVARYIDQQVSERIKLGKRVGVIATDETLKWYHHGITKSIGNWSQEETIARHLYGILRSFDELKVDEIYSEAFDTPKFGQAIMNRLTKAAGQRIKDV